jgi:hypothetical protein
MRGRGEALQLTGFTAGHLLTPATSGLRRNSCVTTVYALQGPLAPTEAAFQITAKAKAAPKTISVFTPAIMMPRKTPAMSSSDWNLVCLPNTTLLRTFGMSSTRWAFVPRKCPKIYQCIWFQNHSTKQEAGSRPRPKRTAPENQKGTRMTVIRITTDGCGRSGKMKEAGQPKRPLKRNLMVSANGETHIGSRAGPMPPGASRVRLQMRWNRNSAGSRMRSRPASRPGGFFPGLEIGLSQIQNSRFLK